MGSMQIHVAQINLSVGDLEGNAQKVTEILSEKKAGLTVFPELTITGYPPQDLLLERAFIEKNKEMLSRIVNTCETSCVVGFLDFREGALYNAAALIDHRKILGVQYKMLLPTYDVFDERRYFVPGESQKLFELHGKKIGLEICEDLWEHNYAVKPTTNLERMGADIIVNISASPFCTGKIEERLKLAKPFAKNIFVYCNLVGGQDELVFDGQSFIMKKGKVVAMARAFEEDTITADSETEYREISVSIPNSEHLFKALVLGLRDYCRKTHFRKVVVGLSGGIDSALVLCLAVEAVGKGNVTAVFMPSKYTSELSRECVKVLSENLGTPLVTLPINSIVDSYAEILKNTFKGLREDTTEENIQARIRGNLLMAYSNKFGHLVLTAGNKTELALGYCTLYGDMSGGLSVIGDVSKLQVYELSRYYNYVKGRDYIPEPIFTRPPSAELREGQVDPFDYSVVSPLVDLIIEERKSREELVKLYPPALVDDVLRRIRISEYKRWQAAPIIKVTKKAFGIGRRYPIANEFG